LILVGFHSGINTGFNIDEATNLGFKYWFDLFSNLKNNCEDSKRICNVTTKIQFDISIDRSKDNISSTSIVLYLYFFKTVRKTNSEHTSVASRNFNLNTKRKCIFTCSCEKEYTITGANDCVRNIISHIKQCKKCVVKVYFNNFIYKQTGNCEDSNIKN